MTPDIAQALQDCCDSANRPSAVKRLRELMERVLIERLTILSVDRDFIDAAIEETFLSFAASVDCSVQVNWLAWITATAMSVLVEHTGNLSWLDKFSNRLAAGSLRERRALVFGSILALDGHCQWALLRAIPSVLYRFLVGKCEAQLNERLAELVNHGL